MNRSSNTRISDDFEIPIDKVEFYFKFTMQRLLKHVEILATENIEEKFTVYTICVRTEPLEFSVQKRYSEFLSLAQKVLFLP